MATIVNTPAASHEHVAEESSSSSMMNMIIGLVVILLLIAGFFYIGLPMMRAAGQSAQAPQINVPDKINVDVNQPQGGNGNAPAPQQ